MPDENEGSPEEKSKEPKHERPTTGRGKIKKKYTSTGRIPMLAVGSSNPECLRVRTKPLLRRSLLALRLTFAVRSRVYLHHKCFRINLVLDLLSRRFGRNWTEEGQVVGGWGVGGGALS